MKTILIFGLPETIQRSEECIIFDSQMPAKNKNGIVAVHRSPPADALICTWVCGARQGKC